MSTRERQQLAEFAAAVLLIVLGFAVGALVIDLLSPVAG